MPSNANAQAIMAAIATDKSRVLGVMIGDKKIEPPGFYIPRGEAKALPQLSFAVPPPSSSGGGGPAARYIVVSMDFDAPYPSMPFFGPVLHWIQSDLQPSPSSADGIVKLEIKDDAEGAVVVDGGETTTTPSICIANYLSPNPPPGSSPHRYGFYLYEQPVDFDAARWAPAEGGKLGNMPRIRYSLDEWEREAGLGEILAANYFTSN